LIEGLLTKVKFFPNYQDCEYTIRIWVGGSAGVPGQLVVDQPVTTFVNQHWNDVILSSPVTLNTSQELWIGVRCNTNGGRPAGCDTGPAEDSRGNMIYWQGAWKTLLEVNPTLNFNWCIQGYIEVNSGSLRSVDALSGYKVYRDGNLLATQTGTGYIDLNVPYGTYQYCVSAVFDVCESNGVCVEVSLNVGIPEADAAGFRIYPNPASGLITIEMTKGISRIEIFNYLGLRVFEKESSGGKTIILDTGGFAPGTYLVHMTGTEGEIYSSKIVIIK
jgi:hypothetical protein